MAIFTILISIFLIILPTLLWKVFYYLKPGPKLPPGPFPLPIIGNFHMLGQLPHRALAKLAKNYGPIMSIKLGQVQTIVVSSPKYAELVLKQHDAVCSGRPDTEAWVAGKKGIAFAPCGDYWRRVRLMCTQHLLSATKMAEFEGLKQMEINVILRELGVAASGREVVNIDKLLGELMENILFSMVVGKGKEGDNTRFHLKDVMEESLVLAGEFNLADFIPFFKFLDLQGITRRLNDLKKRSDKIFDKIIDDHLKEENSENHKDILGTMLNLINKESDKFSNFSRENVKSIMCEMFIGGIETVTLTVTWALSALLKNPWTLRTLQQELDVTIGKERMVKESDLPNLPYLDMVIKEIFRLYAFGPLLVPHESIEDVVIDGYMIPKKSRIIVNIWAIGRDPKIWSENAEEFNPNRFMNSNIDFRGRHFELLPFGAGRRGCPGMLLGESCAKMILAQLVHCFDWELPNGMQSQELDMTEKYGMSTPRANKLLVIPSTRLQVPLE